jgi:hypothetical protein
LGEAINFREKMTPFPSEVFFPSRFGVSTRNFVNASISRAPGARLAKVQIGPVIIPTLRGFAMKTGFGWIEIGDQVYEHDIIIHADGSITKRKKRLSKVLKDQYEHTPLSAEELGFLMDEQPVQVFIGTGQYGSLPITQDAKILLSRYQLVALPTPEILQKMKRSAGSYVAILHVTC